MNDPTKYIMPQTREEWQAYLTNYFPVVVSSDRSKDGSAYVFTSEIARLRAIAEFATIMNDLHSYEEWHSPTVERKSSISVKDLNKALMPANKWRYTIQLSDKTEVSE